MGKFLLGLLWLAAATYGGYKLTDKSFSFLSEPDFGMTETTIFTDSFGLDPRDNIDLIPNVDASPAELFNNLSQKEKDCIAASVDPARLKEAMAGKELKPTPQEVFKITSCLK